MFEDKNPVRTELEQVGQSKLLQHLGEGLTKQQASSLSSFGDEAIVVKHESTTSVFSSDLLLENVHFDLTYVPLRHLGYKTVVVGVSRLIAMNVRPSQISLTLALSNRFSLEAVEELFTGVRLACQRLSIDIMGIQTTSSQSGLCIAISVIGQADETDIVYSHGGMDKQLLCVSGDLGGAYAGLLILQREKAVFMADPKMQPDLQGHEYVVERQLKPEARVDILDFFKEKGIKPTSMRCIDTGLAAAALQLARASALGCLLYEDKIPIDHSTYSTMETFDIHPTTTALNGGEDYELLFSIAQSDYETIKHNANISVVGHFTEKNSGCMLMPQNGPLIQLRAQEIDY
ncbi:thiamine-monophosphate kinase [Bacteroidia bacterium]|nr:thiamine-monophosphate kinase [Bacteroidia bacterium]